MWADEAGDNLVRVTDVEPFVTEADDFMSGALTCYLEHGGSVVLYYVPLEVARAIARLKAMEEVIEAAQDFRDSIYELLIMMAPKLRDLGESIEMVVIDGYNEKSATYSASLYLNADGIKVKYTLIPSHAIFLAMLFNKPIYVTEEIVRISQELESMSEEDEFYDEFEDEF